MAICKSCGAAVIWGQTAEGKRIIMNEKPEKRYVVYGNAQLVKMVNTFISHFATCPDADKWRNKR